MSKAEDTLANRQFLEKIFQTILKDSLEVIKETLNSSLTLYNAQYKYEKDPLILLKSLINDFKDAKARNLLHFAASRGDILIFKYLLENGADISSKDSEGNTVLFIAAQHENIQLFKYLIEELKMDPLSKRDNNVTCLHLAGSMGNIEIIEYLLTKQANLEDLSSYGTVLDWAVSSNQITLVKYLIAKNVNLLGGSSINKNLPPPIIMAINLQYNEIALILIEKDYKLIYCKDQAQWSIFHVACEVGNTFICEKIIEILINQESKEKAVAFCDYSVEGKTALDIAYQYEKWDCVSLLRLWTTKPYSKQSSMVKQGDKKSENPMKAQEIKAIGNELFEKGEYSAALEKYQEALNFDPLNVALYTNSAGCYVKLKDFQKALEASQKAKKIDPKWLKAYFREGEAFLHLKEYGDAAASFWEGLNLEPKNKVFKDAFENAVKLGKEQHKNKD